MIEFAKIGRVAAQGADAQRKRSETQLGHKAAQREWRLTPKEDRSLKRCKPLKILKAIQVIPHGVRNDLSAKLIELRTEMKAKNPKLAAGVKVAANSAAFGLFCQLT